MLPALILLVALVVVAVAVLVARRVGKRSAVVEADRFHAAAALTGRWSRDPQSAPAPVRNIAAQASLDEEVQEDASQEALR